MADTKINDITDQVDGLATTFTVPLVYDAGTLSVFLNGTKLKPGTTLNVDADFVEISPTFNTFEICEPPRLGDTLQVTYEVSGLSTPIPLVQAYSSDPDLF